MGENHLPACGAAEQSADRLGKSPLPIDNEQLQQVVSTLITVVVAIINWWQNNSFTKEAIAADKLYAELRAKNNQ